MIIFFYVLIAGFLIFRKNLISLGFFSYVFYLFIAFSGYQLLEANTTYKLTNYVGFWIYIISYIIPIIPFFIYKNTFIKGIIIPQNKNLITFFKISLIGSIASLIYFLPFSIVALSGDIGENRLLINSGTSFASNNYLNFIFALFAILYPINIICFFYGTISQDTFYSKYKWLFLISSLSYIFRVLAFTGRDGFIFWTIIFILIFIIFKPFISKKNLKFIKFGSVIFIIIGVFILSKITSARFDESTEGNTLITIYDYTAQSIFNFSNLIDTEIDFQYGKENFSLFFKLLGYNYDSISLATNLENNDLLIYIFYGTLGSLYFDFGLLVPLFYITILPIISYKISTNQYNTFSKLALLVLFSHFIYHGTFYYYIKSLEGNLLFLILVLSCFYKSNSNKIILKKCKSSL